MDRNLCDHSDRLDDLTLMCLKQFEWKYMFKTNCYKILQKVLEFFCTFIVIVFV